MDTARRSAIGRLGAERLLIVAGLVLVTLLAWAYLFLIAARPGDSMASMDKGSMDMGSMPMGVSMAAMSTTPTPWTAETFGLMFIFQGVMLLSFGGAYFSYNYLLEPVPIFGANYGLNRVVAFLAAAAIALVLWFFLYRTRYGTAIRAVAVNPASAGLSGINVKRASALAFALGGALTAASEEPMSLRKWALWPWPSATARTAWEPSVQVWTASCSGSSSRTCTDPIRDAEMTVHPGRCCSRLTRGCSRSGRRSGSAAQR